MSRRPKGEMDDILVDLAKYLRFGRTMDHLCERYQVRRQAMHRYFNTLGEHGVQVTRQGFSRPTVYIVG